MVTKTTEYIYLLGLIQQTYQKLELFHQEELNRLDTIERKIDGLARLTVKVNNQ
jgi:hypothetical protein